VCFSSGLAPSYIRQAALYLSRAKSLPTALPGELSTSENPRPKRQSRCWHLASRLQVHARARRQPVAAQTISAANQRGMLETDTGGRFYPPYPVPGCASHSAGLFRKKPTWSKGATMRIIETMPGEPNSSMISSIINLVCPQCGGSMMEFQCCGKCRRNWLTEWEWAMRATGSSNVSSHPGSRRSAQE